MRSWLTATWMIAAASAAQAQTAPQTPPAAPAKPKPVATVPVRPALQTPADTVTAMAQAERLAIQSDLAWAGEYNGAINGEVSERMVAAIKTFQKYNNAKQTGVLNPQERGTLSAAAKKKQDNVGWKLITDTVTGARLGIPAKLVPQQTSDAGGSKWSSTSGTIQILLARAQIGIDPLQHRQIKRVLGAEIVIDQILVDAALLGDAVDAAAAQAMGHEFDPRRVQYFGAAGFRISDNFWGARRHTKLHDAHPMAPACWRARIVAARSPRRPAYRARRTAPHSAARQRPR